MLGLANDVAEALHLHQLAFDHLLRESNEEIEDSEVLLLQGDLEGLHVKPIAG